MTVLVYIGGGQEAGMEMAKQLRDRVDGVSWEICSQPGQLGRLISRPGQRWAGVVAAVGSAEGLRELEALREQLARQELLLILPNQDENLVSRGHRLAPRLLVSGEDAPDLIGMVLNQMMRNRDVRPQAAVPGQQ